ncbi:choline/carnitine/betaine transport [Thioclava sp. ES.031]|uniref:BCCT family transporter n=1 Tax=Thioclava sp. ES.031 TaxID=1798203 RepID=UPI000BF5C0D0|nr:BCCT family transporter [Thioclava sp. ES.031]PFG63203.1 choline/carnitine/betaine transport [Thioclava sp. ES.031]
MAKTPPLMDLHIPTASSGFYSGFSKSVAIPSKILVSALIVWALAVPQTADTVLNALNGAILKSFATWYIYVAASFLILCVGLALMPSTGKLKLGRPGDEPEFSRFSWFSMMFGAGIGIGMLTFATAEPMYHFANNPNVIMGQTTGSGADNVTAAYVWSFLHWGFSAWACYALVGLCLAYFSYRRNLPLTVRSALTPLFGSRLSGFGGHFVDVVAVVATILGVAQTLGFGVEQFVAGLDRVGFGSWILKADGSPSTAGIVVALVIILGASTLSALSGVGKGIKWLSNLNMGLSFFLLAFFILFGSTFFGLHALFSGLLAYVEQLPRLLFTVWHPDGTKTGDALAAWQGSWSVFYWAWWIAFAPFVGVFLARISRGRSIREYVMGAVIVPSLMCFVWFTLVGGTAIDMTLNGTAGDAISSAGQESQLFVMLDLILHGGVAWAMALIVVVLLLTYLVTTADSAILIVNTINAAGEESPKGRGHIVFWGVALSFVVGAMLLVGGLEAIKTAMVIGALPFSFVMFLMCIALVKAVIRDGIRERNGVQSIHVAS